MEMIMEHIKSLNENILWGVPMLALMLMLGIYLTAATGGRLFLNPGKVLKFGIGSVFKKRKSENALHPFAAVSTALAATVGTGNIVGVAIAIRLGGPGAVFWMWVSAFFGMAIKYSEVALAVHYRVKNKKGEFLGGPMYYMANGLGFERLAAVFSFFGALSSFGIGNMVQANSLSDSANVIFGISPPICGVILALLCAAVLIGGIKRISSAAELLVPIMAFFYMLCAAYVIFVNRAELPKAFFEIFKCAFSPASASGGFLGASVGYAMRLGVSRGLFTNEAGLGSAPIAYAASETDHPARQGCLGVFEVFFDTIVMCTVTALVILTSGVWRAPQPSDGGLLAYAAFSAAFPHGAAAVGLGLILFAFASITAWYYYGEKCFEFIFGTKNISIYRIFYVGACFAGCVMRSEAVWEISDTLNAFMALPNLISLFFFFGKIREITDGFFGKY